jgi:predicted methyltransferase
MRSHPLLLCAALVACGASPPSPGEPTAPAAASATPPAGEKYAAPVDTGRPPEDAARDADRKPQEVMDFFGITPGQTVVELMAGRGYYAELLSQRVGPNGKVYAHNSPFVLKRFAEEPLTARLARPSLANVERLDTELDAPGLPDGVDAVVIVLFYHDTYWQEVDRKAMNDAVFRALKPGGIYGVVDHHAEAGSGDRDVQSLHRVDAELVKEEILEAGFELDGESDLLRHPEDDRKTNVFKMRGKTDRFTLRFRKPPDRG